MELRRFDRAALLRYYLSQLEGVRWREPPPHSKRLEKEIARVATLPQPAWMLRAVGLIEAFRDRPNSHGMHQET
jgi:hypothetical protein